MTLHAATQTQTHYWEVEYWDRTRGATRRFATYPEAIEWVRKRVLELHTDAHDGTFRYSRDRDWDDIDNNFADMPNLQLDNLLLHTPLMNNWGFTTFEHAFDNPQGSEP